MKEPKLFEKAIDWAKKKGFSNIKANTEDYETPVKFARDGEEDQPFIPDITATRQALAPTNPIA